MKETRQHQFGLSGTYPGVFQSFCVCVHIADLRFAPRNRLLKHRELAFGRHICHAYR